jgi:unsaturated rhamnogalacturonyl hydrolase
MIINNFFRFDRLSKMVKSIVWMYILAINSLSAQNDWASRMAATVMGKYPDTIAIAKYSFAQAKENAANPQKKTVAKWEYDTGTLLMGFDRLWRVTGDVKYFQYIQKILDHFVTEDGAIRTYIFEEYNIDNILLGRQLLMLYQTTNQPKYLKAAQTLRRQIQWQPRTKEGGFWHKLRYPHQMWLDGLYMGAPFYAEYSRMTGEIAAFDDIANQFIWMEQHARDEKTGLLYHGWDESKVQRWSDPVTGQSKEFWDRAMGWYMVGIVDVLDYFPENHPKRSELIAILNRTANAIAKVQDPKTGLWYQILDKGAKEGNYLEASGAAMFMAAMAKGMRLGYLPDTFLPIVKKAMDGFTKTHIETDEKGVTHLKNTCGGAGLGGDPYRDGTYEYYIKEPTRYDDLRGIGMFMQAAIELNLLEKQQIGRGKTVVLDYFFNNERKKDTNLRFHYTWEDGFDSGYSLFGSLFRDKGAKTQSLTESPTLANLAKANIYIIVDADTPKETEKPNYMEQKHIKEIEKWVANGGTLVLLANDANNAELPHFNELASVFGVQFTDKSRNMVKNNVYEQGKIDIAKNPIFKNAKKIFVKELSVLSVKPPAKPLLEADGDAIMATAQYGKGRVFMLGDPWIYNEYLNGRRLPAEYENFKAANDLVDWLLK